MTTTVDPHRLTRSFLDGPRSEAARAAEQADRAAIAALATELRARIDQATEGERAAVAAAVALREAAQRQHATARAARAQHQETDPGGALVAWGATLGKLEDTERAAAAALARATASMEAAQSRLRVAREHVHQETTNAALDALQAAIDAQNARAQALWAELDELQRTGPDVWWPLRQRAIACGMVRPNEGEG